MLEASGQFVKVDKIRIYWDFKKFCIEAHIRNGKKEKCLRRNVGYMERQQEYELRKKIADAIQNDVNRVFSEKLQLLNHDFYGEILFPLTVLEMTYKKKSDESVMDGLEDANEYLILVNPLREDIYWYIHKELASDKKIVFSKKAYIPSSSEEYSFVEYILQLHDEFKRGEQIREIRDCASKVIIKSESDNRYGFYFPVISEKYHKELLYYYGLDDTLNFEVERATFVECEKYLHKKINVKELITYPRKINIYYNILKGMASIIDAKYFELCKKRVMSDLNKISSSSLRSIDDNTNKVVIGSKDELAAFLALMYYLSRLCMQKYMLVSSTGVGELEYICQYDLPRILSLGKQVGLPRDSVIGYIEYFAMDVNVTGGNFTEFPLIKFKEKIIWIPSSIVLNDFQFSIVNGHYYKGIRFENKDETVSQSIIDYIVNHSNKYSNIFYSTNYVYSVPNETFRGKPFNSDIDVAIYDGIGKKLLIIECKWKENVYQNRENYIRIEDALKKIYDKQLEKHQAYLEKDINNLNELFNNQIDFTKEGDIDTLYLFVDKRIQYHDNIANRHAIPIFMLAYLFENNSSHNQLILTDVFSEIREMQSKVSYERIKLKEPVILEEITVV